MDNIQQDAGKDPDGSSHYKIDEDLDVGAEFQELASGATNHNF